MRKLILSATLLSVLFLSQRAWTKVEYDCDQLQMKNSEQVEEIVNKKIKKAQDIQAKQTDDDDAGIQVSDEAIDELRDAVRVVLSRPDQDGTRANVFLHLRHELTDLNAFDRVLTDLTNEGIQGIKSSSSLRLQATYVVMLENMLSEMKPEVASNPAFKKLVEQIRDANIVISEKLRVDRKMHNMSKVTSPSDVAAAIVPKSKK